MKYTDSLNPMNLSNMEIIRRNKELALAKSHNVTSKKGSISTTKAIAGKKIHFLSPVMSRGTNRNRSP